MDSRTIFHIRPAQGRSCRLRLIIRRLGANYIRNDMRWRGAVSRLLGDVTCRLQGRERFLDVSRKAIPFFAYRPQFFSPPILLLLVVID
jgi:hypothetical protein